MTISRWKVMACTLGLSLGGLALSAGQPNSQLKAQSDESGRPPATPQVTEPAPLVAPTSGKPALPPAAPDTLPPLAIPNPPAPQIEIIVPKLVPASGPMAPVVPANAVEQELVPEPPLPDKPPVKATSEVKSPESAPIQNLLTPNPPAPTVPPSPPVEPIPSALPPTDIPPMNVSPPQPRAPVPPPPMPSTPAPSQPVGVAPATSKLKMLMRLGDGKPRFEIRNMEAADLLLKVYGEKIEMQSAPDGGKNSPIAGVTAVGKVRFVGPGIEGTCDQLSVLSGTGEVLLKGNIHMKTRRGKSWSEMTADKMIYQIGASGLTTPAAGTPPVVPASYQEPRRP